MAEEIVWGAGMDDADFNRGIKRMLKDIDSLKQKLKDAQDQQNKGSRQAKGNIDAETMSLAGLASKLGGVALVTSAVTRTYAGWKQEVDRVREAHKGLHADLVKTIAASRDLANAAQIEKALGNIKGMPLSDATKAFGAATAAAPGLSWQDRVGLARGAAPLVAMGQDTNQHVNIAAKLKQLDPSLSTDDANDLALVMRKRAGEDASRYGSDEFTSGISRLKAAGLTTEQAIAIGMADVESDLPSKGLKSRAEALYGTDPTVGKHGPKSKEDKLKAAYYKLSAQDRLKSLYSDRATADAVLGEGGGLAIKTAGDGSEQREAYRSIFGRDLMAEDQKQFQKWSAGQLAGVQTQNRALTEQQDMTEGGPWARGDALRQRYIQDQRGRGMGMYSRWWKDTELYARQGIASVTGGDQVAAVRQGIQGDINANTTGVKQLPTQADAANYDALVKALNENTAATKANTPKAGLKPLERHAGEN